MRKLIVVVTFPIVVLLVLIVQQTQAKSPYEGISNGCIVSASMPQEQRNGQLVSSGAFECFGTRRFLTLPRFKVCGVRVYENWLGQTKEETVACSPAPVWEVFPEEYKEVRFSCEGPGRYFTELRWDRWTEWDAAQFIATVAAPPLALGDIAYELTVGQVLDSVVGAYYDNDGHYRHSVYYVCTR